MRILIVEDDRTIHFGVRQHLLKQDHEILSAYSLSEAKRLIDDSIDLYLLDVTLPDGSGMEILEAIRKINANPVLFLSAHDDEKTMNQGFDLGADDYITKPFRLSDLDNRIRSILRRSNIKTVNNLTIDVDKALVSVDGDNIVLSVIEYQVLLLLVNTYPKYLEKDRLIESIWGETSDNTVSVTMRRLRSKLGDGVEITNLVGKGYSIQ